MTSWAKAPDFADQPARRAEVRAQTVVDQERYLEDGLTPLRCQACHTEVRVRKSSSRQTSVQWTENPATHCPVFAELSAKGYGPGRPETCERLQKTIKWAVDEGVLEVPE
ncbi:hypothetical protein [Nocardia jinanensis]|uniref:Ferredoxin n=1 Tax=Nocardia jinanensis TaxID=382504 RepID=A0A917RRW7_9NOCA|nr:hypothetical protein [Nocardia jinanensis]GGL22528.1 hypothetical protein GCM10011588_41900 [Nocardia jinanensis]